MASGDSGVGAKHMTFSGCNLPVLGAFIDYIVTSVQYLISRSFAQAERLHARNSQTSLTPIFVLMVCLLLGLVCNVKFEVVTLEEMPLSNDLHFMLMSKNEVLYIDDIDTSRVMLCLEASDALVIVISSLLICISSYTKSPLSEYLFLPWLGATLRGVFLRQAPTAGALLYTMAVINGKVNPLFLSTFCFLFRSLSWLQMDVLLLMDKLNQRTSKSRSLESALEVSNLELQGANESVTLQRCWDTIGQNFFKDDFLVLPGSCDNLTANCEIDVFLHNKITFFGIRDLLLNPQFIAVLESRLWLEMARVVLIRWERRNDLKVTSVHEVETLWSNDDVQSVEVENYVY